MLSSRRGYVPPMEIRTLPDEEAAVRRFVESLWLPYHRELEATVERHALASDLDVVEAEVEYRLELLASEPHRTWVAVDAGGGDGTVDAGEGDGTVDFGLTGEAGDDALAGFVTTDVEESPPVFERPDRLVVGDVYVRGGYRGSGLATKLLETAGDRARDLGCGEVVLDVDVDNHRAVAFYEKLGFGPIRRRLGIDADAL